MKSDLSSLSIQGLYSGNYSPARGQHKLRRSSQCSLSLTEWESKNILAATHAVSVPSSGPPASLNTCSCIFTTQKPEHEQSIRKHKFNQFTITPQLAAPTGHVFSLLRAPNCCFLGCVLQPPHQKQGEQQGRGTVPQQYGSFSNRVKERSCIQCFKHPAVYFEVKH